jgi:hypothetical protein
LPLLWSRSVFSRRPGLCRKNFCQLPFSRYFTNFRDYGPTCRTVQYLVTLRRPHCSTHKRVDGKTCFRSCKQSTSLAETHRIYCDGGVIIRDIKNHDTCVLLEIQDDMKIWKCSQSTVCDQHICHCSSSASFIENTVVIPAGAVITGITLDIRDKASKQVTGSVFFSGPSREEPSSTGISVTVVETECCATASGCFTVNQCGLISVLITAPYALQRGAAAVIYLTTP